MSALPANPSHPDPDHYDVSLYDDISLRRQIAGVMLTLSEILHKFAISPDNPAWGRKLHESLRHPEPGEIVVERSHRGGHPEDWVGRLIWCGYKINTPTFWNEERDGKFDHVAEFTYVVQNFAGEVVTWKDAQVFWLPESMHDIYPVFSVSVTKTQELETSHYQRQVRHLPWVEQMQMEFLNRDEVAS